MDRLAEILQKRSPVVYPLGPDEPVSAAVARMAQQGVGAVPIVAGGELVGIFSERDVIRRVLAAGRDPDRTPLREVMTADPVTAHAGESRASAIVKMNAVGCRHLPIVAGGTVIDMLSIRDLLFSEIAERDAEIQDLKLYIQRGY
jgi:CBS domain-containing protein